METNWRGCGAYYPGSVTQKYEDGTYEITYDDGAVEDHVERSFVRLLDASGASAKTSGDAAAFIEGTKVEANYQGCGSYSTGRISRNCGDNTFDIVYDNGDSESGVAASLIRLLEVPVALNADTASANPDGEDPPSTDAAGNAEVGVEGKETTPSLTSSPMSSPSPIPSASKSATSTAAGTTLVDADISQAVSQTDTGTTKKRLLTTITSPLHPAHDLVHTLRPSGNWGCDGRHQSGGCRSGADGNGYSAFCWCCETCDFDLCLLCAAESISIEIPSPLETRLHEHALVKTICSYSGGSYNCDGRSTGTGCLSGNGGNGFSGYVWTCATCNFDLCPHCAISEVDLAHIPRALRNVWAASKSKDVVALTAALRDHASELEEGLLDTQDLSIEFHDTALTSCCRADFPAGVELLLSVGCGINAPCKEGRSPLFVAAAAGFGECMKVLLSLGASVDLANKDGWSPLLMASLKGHDKAVSLLLKADANFTLKAKDNSSTLNLAISKLIMDNSKLDEAGLTRGFFGKAELEADVVENLRPLWEKARTALKALQSLWAAVKKADIVELKAVLHDHGSELEEGLLDTQDLSIEFHDTALTSCCRADFPAGVELLLSVGCGINAPCKEGRSPLFVAAAAGFGECMKVLLSLGASVDLKREDGWSPVHTASLNGHDRAISLLLSHGADTTLVNKDSKTAMDLSKEKGHQKVVELIEKHNSQLAAGGTFALKYFAVRGDVAKVKTLLDDNAIKSSKDHNANEQFQGHTAAMLAASFGRKEVLSALLDSGCSIDKNPDESTHRLRSLVYVRINNQGFKTL